MMRAPYSAALRWQVIWFVHILQNSVAEASFFLGVCERTEERYISKFLVNGHVKPGPVRRSYGSISSAPHEELIVFAHQYGNHSSFRSCNFPFDNCHSPFSPTIFEIGVYSRNQMRPLILLWIWRIVRHLPWSTASGPSIQIQRKISDLGGN